jgi:hypothetical protein
VAITIRSGQGRHPQSKWCMRGQLFWVKRGLQVSIIGLPTLAIAGTIYQAVATKIEQRRLGLAPGEMVSVGNHKPHINRMGEGSHTVILESGAPGTSIESSPSWCNGL